jgi:hypothetical protein
MTQSEKEKFAEFQARLDALTKKCAALHREQLAKNAEITALLKDINF